MKWNKVSDCKPEVGKDVLGYHNGFYEIVSARRIPYGDGEIILLYDDFSQESNAEYWGELPEFKIEEDVKNNDRANG